LPDRRIATPTPGAAPTAAPPSARHIASPGTTAFLSDSSRIKSGSNDRASEPADAEAFVIVERTRSEYESLLVSVMALQYAWSTVSPATPPSSDPKTDPRTLFR